ncbi:23012_t:CDS:2, partial [Dentiscutata erythropus]
GFRWLDINNLPDIRFISPTAKQGSAWEVKLRYPENLHPTYSDYPLCPECQSYALETEDEYKNIQKAKGLKKSLVKKELTIDIYERCILEGVEDEPRTANFLWILNDQVTTWAIGDCRIPAYLSALEQYENNIPQEILMDL